MLLKLALQIAEVDGAAAGEGGRGRGRGGEGMRGSKDDQSAATVINWGFVVWALWTEVTEGVSKSHGAESGFAAEVRDFGVRSGLEGRKVSLEEIQSEWVKLRALADEGLTAR